MNRPGVILAGVVISALGAMTYNLLPLFVGTAQDFHSLSDRAVGILGSSFFAGFTLTSITAWFWIRRFDWRVVGFGAIPIAAAALLSAGLTQSYLLMAIAIAIAGSAFSVLYGIGMSVIGDTHQPARWYGLKMACEAGLGVALLLILPGAVIQRWGFSGLVVAMAVVLIMLSPLLAGLPAQGAKEKGPATGKHGFTMVPALRTALWLGLAAVLIYLFCTTMTWAFVERIAHAAGFDAVVTGNVLSLGLVLAVCGSLVATVLGDRYGLSLPLAAAALLLLVSLVLLGNMDSLSTYTMAICLFTFSFGLGMPYTVSVVSCLDINGRFVVLTVPAIGIGVMLAPAMGGMLTGAGGHNALLITGAVSVLTSLSLDLMALRLGLPHISSQAAKPVG
jgi:predicted MFS family arabinose efflux permease